MNRIKDNWVEGEVLHASDLNEMARLVNELINSQENIINDEETGDSSTFSSNKTTEAIEEAASSLINDEEASDNSVYSSGKIKDEVKKIKLKTKFVDVLPNKGEEGILYRTPTPGIEKPVPSAGLVMHKEEDESVITIHISQESQEPISGLVIGDVFKYKAPDIDTTKQFCVRTYGGGNGYIYYSYDDVLFSGQYRVGETFKVTSVDSSHDRLVESCLENVRVQYGQIKNASFITMQAGKVYRMTGLQEVQAQSLDEEAIFKEVFVATFEEVDGATSADHETNYLGSIFFKNKHIPPYVVISEIDKDKLIGVLEYNDNAEEELAAKVTNGVLGTITLEDGHYYRLKDRYQLQDKNCSGNYTFPVLLAKTGVEALIYEEVINPSSVQYEDVEFIPGAQALEHCTYREVSYPVNVVYTEGSYMGYYYASNLPSGIKIGDIVKVVGENIEYSEGLKSHYISEINGECSVENEGVIRGIKSAEIWNTGEYYRLTGLYHAISRIEAPFYISNIIVPTFEKVIGTEEADFDVMGIPGILMKLPFTPSLNREWLWVEDGWECISGPIENFNQDFHG